MQSLDMTIGQHVLQEGEFIEVFLLPYDGLYDALLVTTTARVETVLRFDHGGCYRHDFVNLHQRPQ